MDAQVVITGGASGLGRVIAEELLEHGHPVVLVDRDGAAAHRAASELSTHNGFTVSVIETDLSGLDAVRTTAAELSERFSPWALVNNAGGWLPGDQYPIAAPE